MIAWMRGPSLLLVLVAAFALKGWLIVPPSPPARAEAGQFDGSRAIARLERVLGDQRPHPVDSTANDAVRGRLLAELRAIGLEPEIRDSVDCSALPKSRLVSCSRVRNVVATLAGTSPGPHLLLNAHYDSTPTGPGAADDGLGVATMLEIAAILRSSRPPRPVTFLFNEGEEFGLNGASAFVRDDPVARRVNALINIEARGVSGPAIMFETSDPNGAAIAAFAQAAHRPFANSLSMDFAKLIPNTTDAVEFRPAGWMFLNYAIVGNETRYHTPGDTVAALDRASFHHVGSEVLSATRALAAMPDPANAGSSRAVFTDVAGHIFIRLPLVIAGAALALLLVVAVGLAYRMRALGKPLIVAAGMAAAGMAAAALVSMAAGLVRPGDFYRAYPLVAYLAVYAVLLTAMTAVTARWGSRVDPIRMRTASWLLVIIFGAAASIALPGASIFFLIAPAIALIGILFTDRAPRAANVLNIVAAVIQLLMFAQLLALIEMLLIDGPLWAVAPLAALAALPVLAETDAKRMRAATVALLVAAAGLWIAALALPRSSAERPAAFTIDYFRDDTRGKASWAVASKQAPLPDAFPGEWRKERLPHNKRLRWISPAPMLDAASPIARLVGSESAGNGRRIRMALVPGGAQAIAIRFAKGTPVLALGLPGAPIRIPAKGEPEQATLRCSGRSCDGFVVEALLGNRTPAKVELIATRFGLPAEARPLVAARPVNAHPQYSPDSTITFRRTRL